MRCGFECGEGCPGRGGGGMWIPNGEIRCGKGDVSTGGLRWGAGGVRWDAGRMRWGAELWVRV